MEFIGTKDPMLEMLQWVMDKFMEIEVSQKTGEYTENESDTEADGLTSGWERNMSIKLSHKNKIY